MPSLPELAPRQRFLFEYLRSYDADHGAPPTVDQIRAKLKVKSLGTVDDHLSKLESKGLIIRSRRGLTIAPEFAKPKGIPIAGNIAAGVPTEAIEDVEWIDLNDYAGCSQNGFGLRVRGDSMAPIICDGDLAICRATTEAKHGDIAAVTINGEATLKYYHPQKGRIKLRPANPDYKPRYVRQCDVRGVLVSIMRRFR